MYKELAQYLNISHLCPLCNFTHGSETGIIKHLEEEHKDFDVVDENLMSEEELDIFLLKANLERTWKN